MNQQTNENTPTLCRYQELNPEMDAFLRTYLEDGWRRGLRESSIHLHDKIGHYYNSILISLHYYPENQGKRAPKARTRKPRNQITTNA